MSFKVKLCFEVRYWKKEINPVRSEFSDNDTID